jgi:hypothetical protein
MRLVSCSSAVSRWTEPAGVTGYDPAAMRTTTADFRTMIDKVDRGDIRLPEIQRGYVWKPPKIAGLIDSLYRRYPTGSLLLWETDEDVTKRNPAIVGPNAKPMAKTAISDRWATAIDIAAPRF